MGLRAHVTLISLQMKRREGLADRASVTVVSMWVTLVLKYLLAKRRRTSSNSAATQIMKLPPHAARIQRHGLREHSAEPADVVVRVCHHMNVNFLRRRRKGGLEVPRCFKAVIGPPHTFFRSCESPIVTILARVSSGIGLIAAGRKGLVAMSLVQP